MNNTTNIDYFAEIAVNMPIGVYLYHLEHPGDDRTLRLTAVNPAGAKIIGLTAADLVGKTLDENFPGLREKGIPQDYAAVVLTGQPLQYDDLEYSDHRVAAAHFRIRAIPLPNNHVGVLFEDISPQIRLEQELKNSLKKKELLLKEIQHRAKNNLALVASLLNIQSSFIRDEQARNAFAESRQRINTIALLHEKLYHNQENTTLEFGQYARDLIDSQVTSSVSSSRLRIIIDINEIYLDIKHLVPLGLILTELVANSLKHGFKKDGELTLSLRLETKNHHFCLTVADDGAGIPEALDWRNTESLGLQLVILLTEQLGGDIRLERNNGTCFRITFPIPETPGTSQNTGTG